MEKGYSIDIENLKGDERLESIETNPKEYTPDLTKLKEEFKKNKILDGDMIEKLFFPIQKTYDIFISHSHTDQKLAKKLATYLTKEGHDVFLDSEIWGSADELLRLIDNTYCTNGDESGSYSYKKRNFSTAHVYSLLNSALAKAIENSRFPIFITGKNSINSSKNLLEGKVKSPWIHQELSTYNLIKRQRLEAVKFFQEAHMGLENSLVIERIADISELDKCFDLNDLLSKINPKIIY